MKVNKNPAATNGNLNLVRSLAKASTSSITAPETLGATVYRFVLTVPKPSLPMICGKNNCTDCKGTPRQISMPRMSQLVGCLKIASESLRLNFSLTMEELSVCMR